MCEEALQKPTIFYGWWVVAACFVSMLFAGGATFYALPVFLKPLAQEFGWGRGEISAGISIAFISEIIGAPIIGGLTTRYGARAVMIPAAVVGGLALLLLFWLTELWQFYGLRFLMGFGLVGLAFVPVSVTVFRWFRSNRGRALGIVLTGFPLGGLIFTPATAFLIGKLGWQMTFALLGLSIWAILLPVLVFVLRNDPEDLGILPAGAAAEAESGTIGSTSTADRDMSLGKVVRTSSFWVFMAIYFLAYASVISMLVHQFPHVTDLGYGPETAGVMVSAVLGISAIGGLFFGWASDRLDGRFLAAICLIMGAVGVLLLAQPASLWLLCGYVVFFGLAYGGMEPVIAVVVRQTFGTKVYGVVFGFCQSVLCVGGVVGGTALGYVHDATLSYQWGFVMAAVGFTLSAGLMFCIRSTATAISSAEPA